MADNGFFISKLNSEIDAVKQLDAVEMPG